MINPPNNYNLRHLKMDKRGEKREAKVGAKKA
jgi:hypothetical protein